MQTPESPAEPPDFSSQHTANFPELLRALGVSLAVSTYQAGKLILVRAGPEALNTHFRNFPSPMGVACREGLLAVGARHELWQFRNFHQLGGKVNLPAMHDAVFLPAVRLTTGDIRIHEIAWGSNRELWAVNTRFSCLCTFDGYHNFVPRWRPPFVSALVAEDRCHLNGLAMQDGLPAYVTCHAAADTPEGWREHKKDGGCIVEVRSGRIVAEGLAMPHSPRLYAGRLWFLESGCGRLCVMDPGNGRVETVAELPGFTRGLDFAGQFAFVGLSQVRETAIFSGVPISEPERERNCGVWAVDLSTGGTAAFLRFSGTVQEIFAVAVLPFANPELFNEDHELTAGSFFIPPEGV